MSRVTDLQMIIVFAAASGACFSYIFGILVAEAVEWRWRACWLRSAVLFIAGSGLAGVAVYIIAKSYGW